MDYSFYALSEEPFTGFFPQDCFQWLESDVSDEHLALLFSIVEDHCGALMLFKAEGDPWGEQAFYDWWDVEEKIVSTIIDRTKEQGIPLPEGTGSHYLVRPFMEMLGYKDHNGYWRI